MQLFSCESMGKAVFCFKKEGVYRMDEMSGNTDLTAQVTTSEAALPPTSLPLSERVSESLQEVIKRVVGTHRKPPRRLKSFLNGTWFGHPLHPAITDIPIVAWLLTAIFDIIWLIAPTREKETIFNGK
jgi:hypothetical protein